MAGILTAVPALGELGVAFGLGSIIWFIWLGIVMLRSRLVTAVAHSNTVTTYSEATA
jgi:hypothetical protein